MQSFARLADAVAFLADVLSRQDLDTLAQTSRQELPRPWVLDRLRACHESTPFPELYAGREFPPDRPTFNLGSHGKELGHLHIDFVHSPAGWVIEKIWMCR